MWTNTLFLLGRLFFRLYLSFRKATHNGVVFLSSGATRRLKRLRCECLLASSRMVRRPPSSARMEGAISQHWGRLWGLREKPWSFWEVRIHDYPTILLFLASKKSKTTAKFPAQRSASFRTANAPPSKQDKMKVVKLSSSLPVKKCKLSLCCLFSLWFHHWS